MSDRPSDATMAAARRLYDSRPRDFAQGYEIARQWWPHGDPLALSGIVRLAMLWSAPKPPSPPDPVIKVTPIADGRVRFVPEAQTAETEASPQQPPSSPEE